MKKINIIFLLLAFELLFGCSVGSNELWNLSPLVKYRAFPMKKVFDKYQTENKVDGLSGYFNDLELYGYYSSKFYISHNGWISNNTFPFAFNPKGSVSLVSNGISYDTVYYPESGKLLVVWVSNATTNIFYEMTTNERYIHANRKYIAFQKGNMLYVIQTNGTTNWSRNVSNKNFIFKLANGQSSVFAYGEYHLDNGTIERGYKHGYEFTQNPAYLYNMETTESNYLGFVQSIVCFSPKNNLMFYNIYNGLVYYFYTWPGHSMLSNCGMLAVYNINSKTTKPIGDIELELSRKYEDYCDMVIGIKNDLTKFYVLENHYDGLDFHYTNESGQTVTNIDGVWEIDISSLGLKDE